MISSRRILLLRLIALVALLASGALVADSFQTERGFCPLEAACKAARASALGHVLGVPTSVIGLVAFGGLLLLTFLPPRTARKVLRPVGALAALCGVGLLGYQAVVLKSFCPLCLIADGMGLAAGVVTLTWRPELAGRHARFPRESTAGRLRWALAAACVVAVPLAWPQPAPRPAWVPVPDGLDEEVVVAPRAPATSAPASPAAVAPGTTASVQVPAGSTPPAAAPGTPAPVAGTPAPAPATPVAAKAPPKAPVVIPAPLALEIPANHKMAIPPPTASPLPASFFSKKSAAVVAAIAPPRVATPPAPTPPRAPREARPTPTAPVPPAPPREVASVPLAPPPLPAPVLVVAEVPLAPPAAPPPPEPAPANAGPAGPPPEPAGAAVAPPEAPTPPPPAVVAAPPAPPVAPPPPAAAPGEIRVVEYLNAYCAHCRVTHARLDKVIAKTEVAVRRRRLYVWVSGEAPYWARACAAAATQGREDALFEELQRSDSEDAEEVVAAARRAGLDTQALIAAIQRGDGMPRLKSDRRKVLGSHLEGLPTFDIGKRRLEGEQTEAELEDAIRAAVAAVSAPR